jgi:hypothetical protein
VRCLQPGEWPGAPGGVPLGASRAAASSKRLTLDGRGPRPAPDVRIEFTRASGEHGSNFIAVLEPNGSTWAGEQPYLGFVIGDPGDDRPPPDGDHTTVTVTFSDTRKVATYQQTVSVDLHPSTEPGIVSFRNPTRANRKTHQPLIELTGLRSLAPSS